MKIVLAGTPNAGKTTLFNALTRSNLRTGNFHGVTTSPAVKTCGNVTFVDVPGAYSFSAYSMEEKSALDEISTADVVVAVVDSLTLPHSLRFAKQLISRNSKTVVYLTKVDLLTRRGGSVNAEALSKMLGAPVYVCSPRELKRRLSAGISAVKKDPSTTIAQAHSGISAVKNDPSITIAQAHSGISAVQKDPSIPLAQAHSGISAVQKDPSITLAQAYSGGRAGLSRADRLFLNNAFSLIFFVAAMTLTFFLAFHPAMPGARLKELAEKLICEDLCGLVVGGLTSQAVASLVSEGLFGGVGTVLSFLPQLTVLYLILTVLDESGIASALSFTTDGLFEKVRLSGRAAFSLVSGFGCTAAAILTTRGYFSPAAQRRTIAVLPCIPCGAKLPVFLTFLSPLFSDPFPAVTCFYFAGTLLSLVAARLMGGGGEELFSEVAPINFPTLKTVVNKLFFYLKGFIIKVTGPVLIFCIVNWALSHFSPALAFVEPEYSMLAALSRTVLPLFMPMGIADWRIAYAALCGFIAKENVAAAISMLMPSTGLALAPTMGICTFMLLCPACISAFSASVKEVGLKFTLKCFAVQLAAAFVGGYIINFLFTL